MSRPHDSGDETEYDMLARGLPDDSKSLVAQLPRRHRMSVHTTSMTTSTGWLHQWNFDMAVRELLQNFFDYVTKTYNGDVKFSRATTLYGHDLPKEFTKHSTKESTIYQAYVDETFVGHLVTGPGHFVLHQVNTTLFEHHLLHRSTKCRSLDQAGTHGCGMKEAMLYLLSQGAAAKMYMPADSVSSEFPGDAWLWKLDSANRLVVKASKLKTYTSRDFITIVTGIDSVWKFDTSNFLHFHHGQLNVVEAPVRPDTNVKFYRVLMDPEYAGYFFNYGIRVQQIKILSDLGLGIDGEFKLRSR